MAHWAAFVYPISGAPALIIDFSGALIYKLHNKYFSSAVSLPLIFVLDLALYNQSHILIL